MLPNGATITLLEQRLFKRLRPANRLHEAFSESLAGETAILDQAFWGANRPVRRMAEKLGARTPEVLAR